MEPYPALRQDYSDIDPIIDEWAKNNSLHVCTIDKEVEVRSVDVVDPSGQRDFQIWIDSPKRGLVGVHVWDRRTRREDFSVSKTELGGILNTTLQIVDTWIRED